LEEEEILDREIKPSETASIWPYLFAGGSFAGVVKLVFSLMAPQTNLMLQSILLVLISMIMMNTTLNFYYQKKNASNDLRSALVICSGIYILMQLINRLVLYFLGWDPNEYTDSLPTDLAISLVVGAVISLVMATLSRKAD
jgi:DMSO/TMAO reductase YedYZ heme-binding membrane subunit